VTPDWEFATLREFADALAADALAADAIASESSAADSRCQ
jgi:hypothetical protein